MKRVQFKNRFFVIVLFLVVSSVNSQSDSQYTQYMYNTSMVNPGYAGTEEVLKVSLLHRSQWVGMDGSPTTQTLSIENSFKDRVGGSLNLSKDAIGPRSEYIFDVNLSYRIQLTSKAKLSFGLKGGGRMLDVNLNKGNLKGNQSSNNNNQLDNDFLPTLGAGLYFYTDKSYFGISSPNLLENNHYRGEEGYKYLADRHLYLLAGHVFQLSDSFKFKPAGLIKVVEGAPISIDFSANFMYQDCLILGAAYRNNAAVSALVGLYITKKIFIGYAYDYDIDIKQNMTGGSHEIFLGFRFPTNKSFESPRFF